MTHSKDEKGGIPEWVPTGGGEAYASRVREGDLNDTGPRKHLRKHRRVLSAQDYIDGIHARNRTVLGRAITLIESNAPHHMELAQLVLKGIRKPDKDSMRIGITGVPGAGKSTLIETMGLSLCEKGLKVAVLAIDPSSTVTRGSILGDKTRMELLSRHENAFIRPSPTGGCLGGVGRKTRETIQLCEAFGFDIMLLETVGVGQSEVTVRSMVDIFLLVLISGAGDSLQGIKRGVMELADYILINKADGDNEMKARTAKAEIERILRFLQPPTEGWETGVVCVSALKKIGLDALWETVQAFFNHVSTSGLLEERRKKQNTEWFVQLLHEAIIQDAMQKPEIQSQLKDLKKAINTGEKTAIQAVDLLLEKLNS